MKKWLIIFLSLLILANTGLAYRFIGISLVPDTHFSDGKFYFGSPKEYGIYLQELQHQKEFQIKEKYSINKYNIKICKSEIKIKSQSIPSIYIRNYLNDLLSKNILKDSHHTFPFHFFY